MKPLVVLFANGIFVVIDSDSDASDIYNSTDGVTWNQDRGFPQLNNGVYGNGVFLVVGYDFEGGGLAVCCTSTNGVDWTNQLMGTTNYMDSVAYGNGQFFAVGGPNDAVHANAFIMRSFDGSKWFVVPSSFAGPLYGIQYVNGRFYATEIVYHYAVPPTYCNYTSTTGLSWTLLTTPLPTAFIPTSPSTPTNGVYVSLGTNGTLLTSLDAINWTNRITGLTNDLSAVAVGPNNLWLGGTGGAVFRSGNILPSLAGTNLPGSGGFQLSVGGGIGPGYRLEDSTDLLIWSNLYTFTNIEAAPQFLDLSATNYSRRFYRAVWP